MIRILLLVLMLSGCAVPTLECEKAIPYVKLGMSYKFHEFDIKWSNKYTGEVTQIGQHPLGGRLSAGVDCGNYRMGYNHESDIMTNWPFDDTVREYYKDEVFFDYVIKFKPLN